MTPGAYLAAAAARLGQGGYAVEQNTLRGMPVVIGRRKDFKLRWMATQLKTTVVVCAAEAVTYEGWLAYLHDATGIAKAFQGGLPNGLQSGFAAVCVLAGVQVDPGVAYAAVNAPARVEWFQGLTMPAVVDLTSGRAYAYDGSQFVGRVYLPFLRDQRNLVAHAAA